MFEFAYAHGPSEVPLRGETIGAMWDAVVAAHADRPALVSRHQAIRWTYRELDEQVERCARALLAAGVKRGDRAVAVARPEPVERRTPRSATVPNTRSIVA